MLESTLLGKLTLNAIPYHNPIIVGAAVFMALAVVSIIFPLFYYKKWKWLWTEWLTTVDHKKIGMMYIILAFIMLLRGFTDAIMMRLQQALSWGSHLGYLPAYHFHEIVTAHGVIMIFFMAMSFMFGLVNLVVPLQIGTRDVAYPYLNALSFWLSVSGAMLVMISLVVGKFAETGWLAYPPLSELAYSPGIGMDYYLWSLTLSGIGTLIAGVNILVTIIKMRCPGMTLMRMPLFTWSVLCAMILVVIAFPILNITFFMLFLDRFMDTHFFTSGFGGNAMLYINLIWTWGHPEVYILILPAFGIYSEVISTFCKKQLFGYTAMVWATFGITFLAFTVWVHHFFTMGAGANVNAFFGIATMVISIPTGVKIFNWLATMWRGKIHFELPMMWTIAFLVTFTIGGMTGVMMSVPGVDFQMHNSLFLVAHFHNTIIGGVVFGFFAGFIYWFPKATGFKLEVKWGTRAFWLWVIGFYAAFMPLYVLGFMGMTRRLSHYAANTGWHIYLCVAAVGALMILGGIICQLIQVAVSIRDRESLKVDGDPWDGRTLEWATASPPAEYNFAVTPNVSKIDDFWHAKQEGRVNEKVGKYDDIHMPKNTSIAIMIAAFSAVFGFAMIWHIVWLAFAAAIVVLLLVLARTFNFNIDYYITSAEVKATEAKLNYKALS
jgi:cytochrome o ubiquinol oxidase subunit 1